MSYLIVLLCILGLSGVRAQPGTVTSCRWDVPGMGTTFDLSRLTVNNGYTVFDARNPTTQYDFNFCSQVAAPSSECRSNYSTAYQLQTNSMNQEACYDVGGPALYGWNFSLADPEWPARGVSINYTHGESVFCPGTSSRTFSLQLFCANVPLLQGLVSAYVEEYRTCDYSMILNSDVGCPTQCMSGADTICSSKGICGYDTDSKVSRCYCYNNYGGDTCQTFIPPKSGMSAEGVILIIVCLVLCAVIGLVVFMFFKLRKLQIDPTAYGELEGRFNELGMLA